MIPKGKEKELRSPSCWEHLTNRILDIATEHSSYSMIRVWCIAIYYSISCRIIQENALAGAAEAGIPTVTSTAEF
jgi:hypothetical protein